MTRKDYILIAKVLKAAKEFSDLNELRGIREVESRLITELEEENPRFDKNRFVNATSI